MDALKGSTRTTLSFVNGTSAEDPVPIWMEQRRERDAEIHANNPDVREKTTFETKVEAAKKMRDLGRCACGRKVHPGGNWCLMCLPVQPKKQ